MPVLTPYGRIPKTTHGQWTVVTTDRADHELVLDAWSFAGTGIASRGTGPLCYLVAAHRALA